jgi:PadR family transcriptional regulator, regulatory protein PadR
LTNTQLLDRKFQKEISAGITALILLKTLDQAEGPMYGYQIAKEIITRKGEALQIKQGVLYPVLHSLESQGQFTSNIEPSVSGPPRRYYSITPEGRQTLLRWSAIWHETKLFVDEILGGKESD